MGNRNAELGSRRETGKGDRSEAMVSEREKGYKKIETSSKQESSRAGWARAARKIEGKGNNLSTIKTAANDINIVNNYKI